MPPVFQHGQLRLYLLALLEQRPMHGYEVITALSDRFGGTYRPSAGTVYPRLARLEEEGLVERFPFRGAFVVEVSAQEVAEIASVRLLVEPHAGELALEALRGSRRPRLDQALADLSRATETNDIPASIDAHLQFHRLFYELSGHGVLGNLWNGWESKLRLYLAVDHRSYHDLHEIAAEHERLAAVALEGDAVAFRQELARHFRSALHGEKKTDD